MCPPLPCLPKYVCVCGGGGGGSFPHCPPYCAIYYMYSMKVKKTISNYKMSNRHIGSNCRKMSEMLLLKLDRKCVYEGNQFLVDQNNHCKAVLQKLKAMHVEVVDIMNDIYKVGYLIQGPNSASNVGTRITDIYIVHIPVKCIFCPAVILATCRLSVAVEVAMDSLLQSPDLGGE